MGLCALNPKWQTLNPRYLILVWGFVLRDPRPSGSAPFPGAAPAPSPSDPPSLESFGVVRKAP